MKSKGAKKHHASEIQEVERGHRVLEKINCRAYELWEAGGCQHGCDMNHWLQAERETREIMRGN